MNILIFYMKTRLRLLYRNLNHVYILVYMFDIHCIFTNHILLLYHVTLYLVCTLYRYKHMCIPTVQLRVVRIVLYLIRRQPNRIYMVSSVVPCVGPTGTGPSPFTSIAALLGTVFVAGAVCVADRGDIDGNCR